MEKKNQVPKYPPLRFPEFTDEWKEVKLGEVTSERNETNTPTLPLLSITANKGVIPQTDSEKKDVSNADKSKYKRICSGDIGYNTMRMWQGRSALSFIEGIVSPAYTIVTPLKGVSPLFLSYLIKRPRLIYEFWTHSQGLVEDTLNCKYKDFAQITITIPSLSEQRKIAALLSLIDERIEVQNAIIKEREAQKAALLRRLFDRTLRFPEFTDEWKKVKLGEVAEIIGGGTPSTTTTNYWDGEIVWFNPSEIGKKKYVSNSNRTISFQGLSNSGARLLPKGTVLLTTRATIGEIAIANVECTTNQGFQSVVTGHEANNEYVYYFLSTQKVYLLRHSSGSTFLETPSSVIRNLPLRLPSLPEQKKIAALLSAIDERLDVERAYAEQLKLQKAYLLRQMFI